MPDTSDKHPRSDLDSVTRTMWYQDITPPSLPYKVFYLAYSNLKYYFYYLPKWTFKNLFASWRPRPAWSLSQCLFLRGMRYWDKVEDIFRIPPKREHYDAPQPTGKNAAGFMIDGIPEELIVGNIKMVMDLSVSWAQAIPGYWMYPQSGPPKDSERKKVLLFLHGGGYVALSAHPSSPTSAIPRSILKLAPNVTSSMNVEYRLSAPRDYPFPSALLDALSGYYHLLHKEKYAPEDVIVVGDSAGGNLAMALVRYTIEHNLPELPKPGGMILLSPWSNLSDYKDPTKPWQSAMRNEDSDFISVPEKDKPEDSVVWFTGVHGPLAAVKYVYISPASSFLTSGEFKNFPKTLLLAGEAEVLLDQIHVLRDRMVADMGSDVTYFEAQDAVHDFVALPFEPARSQGLKEIEKWIAAL